MFKRPLLTVGAIVVFCFLLVLGYIKLIQSIQDDDNRIEASKHLYP